MTEITVADGLTTEVLDGSGLLPPTSFAENARLAHEDRKFGGDFLRWVSLLAAYDPLQLVDSSLDRVRLVRVGSAEVLVALAQQVMMHPSLVNTPANPVFQDGSFDLQEQFGRLAQVGYLIDCWALSLAVQTKRQDLSDDVIGLDLLRSPEGYSEGSREILRDSKKFLSNLTSGDCHELVEFITLAARDLFPEEDKYLLSMPDQVSRPENISHWVEKLFMILSEKCKQIINFPHIKVISFSGLAQAMIRAREELERQPETPSAPTDKPTNANVLPRYVQRDTTQVLPSVSRVHFKPRCSKEQGQPQGNPR